MLRGRKVDGVGLGPAGLKDPRRSGGEVGAGGTHEENALGY